MATPRPQQQSIATGPPDPDALVRELGGTVVDDPDALVRELGGTVADAPAAARPADSPAGGLRKLWDAINPVTAATTLGGALPFLGKAAGGAGTLDTVGGILQAQGALAAKAQAAADRGDYLSAVRHAITYLIPLLGPGLDESGDLYAEGRPWEATGLALGLGLGTVGPTGMKGRTVAKTPRLPPPANAAEAAAVQSGLDAGIELSAGVQTGNRAVQAIQAGIDHTLPGALVAEGAAERTAAGLTRRSRELMRDVSPAPVTREQAGRGLATAFEARQQRMSGVADRAYDVLRATEADPANARRVQVGTQLDPATNQRVPVMADVPLPADVRAARATIAPLVTEIERGMPIAQAQMDPGLKALHNVLGMPDHVSVTTLNDDLSAIKEIVRSRTVRPKARRLAVIAVRELEKALDAALVAHPEARAALARGRAATRAKKGTQEVAEGMFGRRGQKSPVTAVHRLVAEDDTNLAQLRDVQRLAPKEIPKIARAYLTHLFRRATAEGSFTHGDWLLTEWQKLGPKTRKILFRPAQLHALDDFFLLVKKVGFKVNPSGTAPTVVGISHAVSGVQMIVRNPLTGIPYALGPLPIAKLLHSPGGTQALMRGLRLRVNNRLAAAATAGEILKFAGDDAQPVEEEQ